MNFNPQAFLWCHMKWSLFYKNIWLAPFLVFFSTYFALHLWFTSTAFPTPTITGMHLVQATKLLSEHHLHPEIIQIKEDKDIPAGTIIHQSPPAGRMIKEQQTVYIVMTEKPKQHKAPSCVGLSREQIKQIAHAFGLKPKFYTLPYPYLADHCFAQWPTGGQEIKSKSIICYMAQEEDRLSILPSFKGTCLDEVKAFVEPYGMTIQTNMPIEPRKTYYIKDQQPKAGSIINLNEDQNMVLYLSLSKSPVKP